MDGAICLMKGHTHKHKCSDSSTTPILFLCQYRHCSSNHLHNKYLITETVTGMHSLIIFKTNREATWCSCKETTLSRIFFSVKYTVVYSLYSHEQVTVTLDGEMDFVIKATVESVHISKSQSFVYIVFEISFKDKYRFLLGLLKSQ